jgi:hypothetical protein
VFARVVGRTFLGGAQGRPVVADEPGWGMPSKSSTPNSDRANLPGSNAPGLLGGDERTRATNKAVGTLQRREEARRADRLAEIRVQIANGTLVVRQMTAAEREAASEAARQTRAPKRSTPQPRKRKP